MARCNDCNKFVSYGDPEIETNLDANIDETDGSVQVTGDVSCTLTCGDCGSQLKQTSFDVDENVPFEGMKLTDATHEVEVETSSEEGTSRTEGKGRGLKTFYGVNIEITVTAKPKEGDAEPQTVTINFTDDTQASSFEDY